MEFKKPQDDSPVPSPCPYLPGFQQDPQHKLLVFGLWFVGHEVEKGGSYLETQGLASTCTCMKSNKIKCNTRLSARPRLCLAPRARRGMLGSGAGRDTNTLQTLTARCCCARLPRGPCLPGRTVLPPTRQAWPAQGGGTGAKMCPPAWPQRWPCPTLLCCATLAQQLPQDLYRTINIIHVGKDIDLQISLTFTNKWCIAVFILLAGLTLMAFT